MRDRETDQNQAMAAAGPILSSIYRILDESVSFYFGEDYSADARAQHDGRALANCIYSHAERRMIEAAEQIVGLYPLRVRGLVVLNYRDRAIARFKKVNGQGKHRNYQTQQQQDYDDQKTIPGLPDPAYRLTAGYELDASGTALQRIMIARPIGQNIFWTAQVTMVDGAANWQDITPRRFEGTDGSDFDADRARARRGR
jgi:hypothetical protein